MEKVAFMGQIPVKVRGVVLTGDYILPSELHDGTGIAVSPNKITAEQYRKIVGVAWSNSFIEKGVSFVNMAIGLNSNDVSTLVAKQEKKILEMENKYKSLEERLIALEKGTNYTPAKDVADVSKDIPSVGSEKIPVDEEAAAYQMPSELSDEVMKEAIAYLGAEYKRRGLNPKSHPGMFKLLTDMDFQAEVIQKTKETYKATYQNYIAGVRY
jgi:hypothetical protein